MSNQPPIEVPQGAIRLNTDSQKLEFFAQDRWYEMATEVISLDGGNGRGIAAGGNTPGQSDVLEYITIPTQGNSIDFGNMTTARQSIPAATGSSTRGLVAGGQEFPARVNTIDFITFSSTGNATDFGDLTVGRGQVVGTGSQTRGLFSAGQSPSTEDVIDAVTIAATGNAIDFGNLTVARRIPAAASSPTRSLIAGGLTPTSQNVIDYVTTSTTGNAEDFGDLTVIRYSPIGVSSKTRAAFMGGSGTPDSAPRVDMIDFVEIATRGNAQDFGDLTEISTFGQPASDSIRGVRMGGVTPLDTSCDYINIATEGNAVFFGSLLTTHKEGGGLSNAHGGL